MSEFTKGKEALGRLRQDRVKAKEEARSQANKEEAARAELARSERRSIDNRRDAHFVSS